MSFADLARKPHILLIVTDQEREAMHWPAGWAEANLPARSRLMASGLHFRRAPVQHGRVLGQPRHVPDRPLPCSTRGQEPDRVASAL